MSSWGGTFFDFLVSVFCRFREEVLSSPDLLSEAGRGLLGEIESVECGVPVQVFVVARKVLEVGPELFVGRVESIVREELGRWW